jgi:eukaryotic-like serine/threonine-protein kinase
MLSRSSGGSIAGLGCGPWALGGGRLRPDAGVQGRRVMGGDLMAQPRGVPGYTEVKVLGSGGFGEVVLARHDASGTPVAIKYLRRQLLADPGFAGMFRAEAAVLASLDDPNVVRLYEYVESPGGAAIVMELVEGVSLREILARHGRTTPEAALVVLQGSLLGLAAAHRRGVVHRDYKPENVLIDGAGGSKLTDFGIAARAGQAQVRGGTLAYAPPEQFGGSPASPAGDVYAATATFYECLTGRPPFTGESPEHLLYQHLAEPVPLDPVPGPLRPLIAAGLAKDPGRRPADGTALVAELRAAAWPAYGPGWEDRGRARLGEAALLLAALWPSGEPAVVQGSTVDRVALRRRLRHLSAVKTTAMADIVIERAAETAAPQRARHGRSRRRSGFRQLSPARSWIAATTAITIGAVVAGVIIVPRVLHHGHVTPVRPTTQNPPASVAPNQTTSAWSPPSPIDPGRVLDSVSCASPQFCVAVDDLGNALTFKGTSWSSPQLIDPNNQLLSVSCPSANLCVATDSDGNVLAYNGSFWSPPHNLVPSAGANHYFLNAITSVSCPSSSFCMAVAYTGEAFRYDGSSWSAAGKLGGASFGVSCASKSFCLAADGDGNTFTYDGSSWFGPHSLEAPSGGSGLSVSCGSTSFCVAVDGLGGAFVYDKGSWKPTERFEPLPLHMDAVSCPSSSFCIAVDSGGRAIRFDNNSWSRPYRINPTKPSPKYRVDGVLTGSLDDVSCPSTSFCVVVDNNGDALIYG